MPFKKCPQCDKDNGVRTLKCECGHVFSGGKKAGTEYPSGGEWRQRNLVKRDEPDLPPLEPTRPLRPGTLSNDEIREYVSEEGVGFCIHELIPVNRINDPRLAVLWLEARQAIVKVMNCLY